MIADDPRTGEDSGTAELSKRAYVGFPDDYDDVGPEAQQAICAEMAKELRHQLGIEDWPFGTCPSAPARE